MVAAFLGGDPVSQLTVKLVRRRHRGGVGQLFSISNWQEAAREGRYCSRKRDANFEKTAFLERRDPTVLLPLPPALPGGRARHLIQLQTSTWRRCCLSSLVCVAVFPLFLFPGLLPSPALIGCATSRSSHFAVTVSRFTQTMYAPPRALPSHAASSLAVHIRQHLTAEMKYETAVSSRAKGGELSLRWKRPEVFGMAVRLAALPKLRPLFPPPAQRDL